MDQQSLHLHNQLKQKEKFFSTLDEQRLHDKTITMFMFDLNYLKITNDKFGHKAGDQLLYGLALCIRETLGKYGRTYRLGGDEFAALIPKADKEIIISLAKEKKYNTKKEPFI